MKKNVLFMTVSFVTNLQKTVAKGQHFYLDFFDSGSGREDIELTGGIIEMY